MAKKTSPTDLITVREAKALLGISPTTMARLIRNKDLTCYPNPLDMRVKLISKAEVLSLIPRRAEAA